MAQSYYRRFGVIGSLSDYKEWLKERPYFELSWLERFIGVHPYMDQATVERMIREASWHLTAGVIVRGEG